MSGLSCSLVALTEPSDAMNVSFTPRGDFFIFDDDGKTIKRGFRTKAEAVLWLVRDRTVKRAAA